MKQLIPSLLTGPILLCRSSLQGFISYPRNFGRLKDVSITGTGYFKALILLTLLCTLTRSDLSAQNTNQARFGISGGGTAAGFELEEEIDNENYNAENKLGFNGGIKFDVPFNKVIRITPELFINQNGSKDEYIESFSALSDGLLQNKIALDYVGVYVPLKFQFFSEDTYKGLYVLGAFYSDYALSGKVTTEGETKDLSFGSQKDKFDTGGRVSLGLMFDANMSIEVGYNKGLSDIRFSTKQTSSNTNYLVLNKGLTLSIVRLF